MESLPILWELTSAGMTAESTYLWVSSFGCLATDAVAIIFLPRQYRLVADTNTSVERWAAVASSVFVGANFLLFAGNLLFIGRAWPLISTFSAQIVFALWIFLRLLTRQN